MMDDSLKEAEKFTRKAIKALSMEEQMQVMRGVHPDFGIYSNNDQKTLTKTLHISVVPEGWIKEINPDAPSQSR